MGSFTVFLVVLFFFCGTVSTNAGPTNAGSTNAGPTNAGPTNAGSTNAGPTNSGAFFFRPCFKGNGTKHKSLTVLGIKKWKWKWK